MTTISTKSEEAVDLKKGYYHVVHVFLEFNKEGCFYQKEE